jgi:hypothetical protein
MESKYGIDPDRLYSEVELDQLNLRSRAQRNRLRKQKRFPPNFAVTPGRKATTGRALIEYLERQMFEAGATP